MFQEGGKWVDAACIVVLEREEDGVREGIVWSDRVEIPGDMKKGSNGEWSVLKDPHVVITGKPRTKFLSEALMKFLQSRNPS